MKSDFVEKHSFSLMIHYVKEVRRYKKDLHKTKKKSRDIMYASHRDACILSYYSYQLNALLNKYYEANGLGDSVIAYRSLGKGSYEFSAEAYKYAISHSPCVVLAFDVSGFFDNLDHSLLKRRLKRILNTDSLSDGWYEVFKFVTKFHYVELEDCTHCHRCGHKSRWY